MHEPITINQDAGSLRIGIAVSRYHRAITDALLDSAIDAFTGAGGDEASLTVVDAPGAWELTAICCALANLETSRGEPSLHAIVALGCVITGETMHDQYIAQSLTQGLTAITVESGIPIGFGVLTCASLDQARARATGETNKGGEAMRAAIASANAIRALRQDERARAADASARLKMPARTR